MNFFTKLIWCIIMLEASLCAAQNEYDFRKAEMECRKLVYSNPAAALPIIRRTLQQEGELHDTIYGNTYNLYGIYYSMIGKSDSTIYYIKKSISYLGRYPRNRARSLLSLSMAYRKKADYDAAIRTLNETLEIQRKEKNQVGIAMTYGELASNYNLTLEYDKSIDYLLKAIAILKSENNTKQLTAVKQKLANTYMAKNNFRFAADLYRECLAEFKASGMTKNYYLTLTNLGEALTQLNKKGEAKKVLLEAVVGLKTFGDKELIGVTYSKIAAIEAKLGQKQAAALTYKTAFDYLKQVKSQSIIRISGEYINLLNEEQKYKEALDIVAEVKQLKLSESANLQDRMVYQNAIAATYKGTNNTKEAIKAYEHTIKIKDSLAALERNNTVEEIQAKFQTELQREKNLALEARNKALKETYETEQKLMLLYIVGSIVAFIMIFSLLRGARLKNRLQKEKLKGIEAENLLIKQQQEHEQVLINSQKAIIDEKQRELTSSALRMANYQDHILQVINKCEDQKTSLADVKKELQQLIKQKDYWKQFETRFNTLHPEFSSNLTRKFSKLTKNDLEFCSLLKLNMSNKEIAALLQISHESAITKKYRIKKKMEINDDTEFEKILLEL